MRGGKETENYNKVKGKEKDLSALGSETDKQIEASGDRRGRERWMSRFRGQKIREEIKAWRKA